MKRTVILLFFIFSLQIAFSQEFEMIRHQVQLGETVRMISKKYKVEPSEIYKLNKFAIDGISQGMVLQIMIPKKDTVDSAQAQQGSEMDSGSESSKQVAQNTQSAQNPDESTNTTTTTTRKVTTIIRKKAVTDDANPPVTQQETPAITSTSSENTSKTISHTVEKGETLFSIAKRYDVSVDDIKAQNAVLQSKGLQTGQTITISTGSVSQSVEKVPDNVAENSTSSQENAVSSNGTGDAAVKHTVAKGETLYSLSKKYNVTVDQIKAQNEETLAKGLQVGQTLYIGK
ncbi:MAG: LysM peptidoglycan-binding domain-containing protein [Flavobacterium sp.]|nr:MAG: LysM peptidoglycan-binding domain-containing protein [Flavobacterium sp.]